MPNRLLALVLIAACSSPGSAPREATFDQPTIDSVAVHENLSQAGYDLKSLLEVAPSGHIAVTARRQDTGGLRVVVMNGSQDGYRVIGSDILFEDAVPTRVGWLRLDREEAVFTYSHDYPTEGILGTFAYRVRNDSLQPLFVDTGRICRPSVHQDLDGDGVPELVRYSEALSGTDCSHECSLAIEQRYPHGGHWASVLAWDGSAWVSADRSHAAFYRHLASTYEDLQRWLVSDSGMVAGCEPRRTPWIGEAERLLSEWISRANALGTN